jgi:ferrous iron transport protein A
MNAPFPLPHLTLDRLPIGVAAVVEEIRWDDLGVQDAARMRHFGFDQGVSVEAMHLGPFGRDPLAIRVGRMTVAIRRRHAAAVRVRIDTE